VPKTPPHSAEDPRPLTGAGPRPARVIAYCRISSRDQNPQLQHDAPAAHGQDLLFTETMSGRRAERPGWQACLAELRSGDAFLCWKSDRFGRSAAHVLTVINQLRQRGGEGRLAHRELRPGDQGWPVHVRGLGRGRRVRD